MLIILLIIGVIIAAVIWIISVGGEDDANKQINQQTGSNSTPEEKAQDAVDTTQQAKDRAEEIRSELQDN